MTRPVLLALLAAALGGCTYYPKRGPWTPLLVSDFEPPPEDPPAEEPATEGSEDDGSAGEPEEVDPDAFKMTVIPLPVAATSAEKGPEGGLLVPILFSDAGESAISSILAPVVTVNEINGIEGDLSFYRYYPNDLYWGVEIGASTEGDLDNLFELRMPHIGQTKLFVDARVKRVRELSERFFGLGPDAEDDDESAYTNDQFETRLELGYAVHEAVRISVHDRYTHWNVRDSKIDRDDIRPTQEAFRDVPGVRGTTGTHAPGLTLELDTRDARYIPTEGFLARLSAEFSQEAFGSGDDFEAYTIDLRGYIGHLDRAVLALRLLGRYTAGHDLPFQERFAIGGDRMLRAHPRGRFVDNNGLVLNVEERIRVFEYDVFDHSIEFELAPFIDIGTVQPNSIGLAAGDVEINAGIGFRVVVRPNVVGRVDVGIGEDGIEVFAGLDYPF